MTVKASAAGRCSAWTPMAAAWIAPAPSEAMAASTRGAGRERSGASAVTSAAAASGFRATMSPRSISTDYARVTPVAPAPEGVERPQENEGGRLARKAAMPSWASGVWVAAAMTSTARA